MRTESIKNPTLGTTLGAMSRLAQESKKNPDIRMLVERICSNVEPGDYASEVCAIYYWVCQNIRYMRDIQDVETLKSPEKLLETRSGDCDDIATLLGAMLMTCGNECRFIVVSFRKGVPAHVFCQVRCGTQWVTVDPVARHATYKMHKDAKDVWVFKC